MSTPMPPSYNNESSINSEPDVYIDSLLRPTAARFCTTKTIFCICITVAIISLVFGPFLFYHCIKPARDYLPTKDCVYLSTTNVPYSCCFTVNCVSYEAPWNAPTCAISDYNTPLCGNGYKCLYYGYTYYPCPNSVSSSSVSTSICSRYECQSWLNNQQCSRACQTCNKAQTSYKFITKGHSTHNNIFEKDCGLDTNCLSTWTNSHPANTHTKCWYDTTDINKGVETSNPICSYTETARFFMYFFLVAFIASIVVIMVVLIKRQWYIKSHQYIPI